MHLNSDMVRSEVDDSRVTTAGEDPVRGLPESPTECKYKPSMISGQTEMRSSVNHIREPRGQMPGAM